jgi:hypothetical protein
LGDPGTSAGRALLRRYPVLHADEVAEVERQARGQGLASCSDRMDRVVDRLHHLLSPEQLGAVSAVRALDPDAIASLDDETMRGVLAGLSDVRLTATSGPEARGAGERYHDEIG